MSHITEDQLNDLRAALEAESDSLGEELAAHGKLSGGDWQGASSEQKGIEADPTDAADQIEELVTNVPLVEELEKRYKEVAGALQDIEHGVYGICEDCEDLIPIDRLRANPAARKCVAHSK